MGDGELNRYLEDSMTTVARPCGEAFNIADNEFAPDRALGGGRESIVHALHLGAAEFVQVTCHDSEASEKLSMLEKVQESQSRTLRVKVMSQGAGKAMQATDINYQTNGPETYDAYREHSVIFRERCRTGADVRIQNAVHGVWP